jgi:hypothetical protein
MQFTEHILYKFIPPDFKLEKYGKIHVLQRSIIIEVHNYDDNPDINFIVEEALHIDMEKKYSEVTKLIHSDRYFKSELPENLHLMLHSLATNEARGLTSRSFAASLLYEICIRHKVGWISKYFPNWKIDTTDFLKGVNNE